MSLAIVAAMVLMTSCACNSTSQAATKAATECADCAGCDKADSCGEAEACNAGGCEGEHADCGGDCANCDKAE